MSALTIAAQDSATMLWREIKHSIWLLRLLIVSAILVPVVMLLLFDYICTGSSAARPYGWHALRRGEPWALDVYLRPRALQILVDQAARERVAAP